MEKVKTSKEHGSQRTGGTDRRDRLDQLIGQMEQQAPQGTALDAQGHAPLATCSRFIYCV